MKIYLAMEIPVENGSEKVLSVLSPALRHLLLKRGYLHAYCMDQCIYILVSSTRTMTYNQVATLFGYDLADRDFSLCDFAALKEKDAKRMFMAHSGLSKPKITTLFAMRPWQVMHLRLTDKTKRKGCR